MLAIEGAAATVFRFQDDVHESSAPAMAALRAQRPPPRLLILTGDREANARAVAAQLGITVLFTPQQSASIPLLGTYDVPRHIEPEVGAAGQRNAGLIWGGA